MVFLMWIDRLVVDHCDKSVACLSWIPETNYIVLGNSNSFEKECHTLNCEMDSVPVLKRSGGGGTVVLHSGCVVVSIGIWVSHYYKNAEYFKFINDVLIKVLKSKYPQLTSLDQNGISDITLEGKKIAGTSIYRSRNYLMYQASILVDAKIGLIERYLAHPSKEPEYRKGKPHSEFVMGILDRIESSSPEEVLNVFKMDLKSSLEIDLKDELISPVPNQISYLKKRFDNSGI